MASVPCPRCGYQNQPDWTFCTNCGGSLSASAPGAAAPLPPAYTAAPGYAAYPHAYGAPPWQVAWSKQVDRTKTGLLLLLVGSLISWIPFIGAIGFLLLLIGAILVILGRKAFGAAHRRNVVLSIVFFVVGIAVAIVGAVLAFVVAFDPIIQSGSEAEIAAALRSAFFNLMVIAIVGSAISGLASVFFTYALQKVEGRILLWTAYGATIGVGIATLVLLLPALDVLADQLARQIATGGTVDPTLISASFTDATLALSALDLIPSLLFAAAAYLAWSRVNRGEIPERPAFVPPPMAPPMTPFSPPSPPSPPTPPANP